MHTDTDPIKDAVIIGAGISGLALAFRLKQAGLETLVLEKTAQAGGVMQTEQADGFLIDCGPNSTLDTSPKIRQFLSDVGLTDSRLDANACANRRYILRGGKLQALPMNPLQFMKSGLFSTRAKFRLLAEPFISPAPADKEETISEFVERRLGREFLDYAINPFIAGVYAGDPDRLSVRSAVTKIYALEKKYGSLIKGAIKGARERKKRAEVDKTRAGLFSFKNGMSELPTTLSVHLKQNILVQTELEQITPPVSKDGLYILRINQDGKVSTVQTNALIFATPAFVTAGYLSEIDVNLSAQLHDINYPPVAMVFLGYKNNYRCRPLDGFGFLVPKVEQRNILGVIWSSTLFPQRAPEGGIAVTTFVGGMRQPQLTEKRDEDLIELVRHDLKDLLQLQGEPAVVKIKKWPRAIPQYELGHQKKIAAIEKCESERPGLFITGNFRGGISVGDCIVQSEIMADKVLKFFKTKPAFVESKVNA